MKSVWERGGLPVPQQSAVAESPGEAEGARGGRGGGLAHPKDSRENSTLARERSRRKCSDARR